MTGRWTTKLVTVTLALLILSMGAFTDAPVSASSLTSLRQQQSRLKREQEQISGDLKSLRNNKTQKVEYKKKLDSQIAVKQNQIDNLNQQIAGYDADIQKKEAQIADKQKSIQSDTEKFKERVRAMYLTGEASQLEIILNAESIMDLADKAEILKAISRHDTQLINRLKSDMESVKIEKEQIQSSRKSVTDAKSECKQDKKELTQLENEVNRVIAGLSAEEKQKLYDSEKISGQQKQADKAIDDWYRSYYEAQKKKQQEQEQKRRKSGGSGGSGGSAGGAGSGGYVSSGHFAWPVPSCTNITSGFGWRNIGGGSEYHKGIDISRGGIYGAAIVAADSGRVIQAGMGFYGTGYGGYGNVVAIDHGGGYSTLYGHMSSVSVHAGQQVSKGQVIGHVGSTGQATGPHLHFEIRVNGTAQNPMKWFG